MLDWLKKLGGDKPWQNKAGLDEKSIALLAEDFGLLEKLQEDLAPAILRYILDDEGNDILARLQGIKSAGELLGVSRSFSPHIKPNPEPRTRFFNSGANLPPRFLIRLGKVYEAAALAPLSHPIFQNVQRLAFLPEPGFGDVKLSWLDALLVTATGLTMNTWPPKCHACPALNADLIEQMLELEGFEGSRLIRAVFPPKLPSYGAPPLEPVFVSLKGIGASTVRHRDVLLETLHHPDFKQRVYALQMIKKCSVPIEPFAAKLTDLAVGSSKQAREHAEDVLSDSKPLILPLLREKVTAGENDERIAAARLIWRWDNKEPSRHFLSQHLEVEKSKKVAQAIRDLLAEPTPTVNTSADDSLRLPDLPPIPDHLPLGPETEKAWNECFQMVNEGIARMLAGGKKNTYNKDLKPFPPATIQQAFTDLAGGKCGKVLGNLSQALTEKEIMDPVKTFLQRPELQPVHFVRFMFQVGGMETDLLANERYPLFSYWLGPLVIAYFKSHPAVGLRDLGAAFTAAGFDASRIGRGLMSRFGSTGSFGLPREKVWPYWAEHLDLLESTFAPPSNDFMARYYQREARPIAFDVIAGFPQPPARLQPLLWNMALGPKSERPAAQKCLANVPDKRDRLVAALAASGSETRFAAADWLGRLGDNSVVNALIEALKREKNEAAKGAMMGALEQLGAPVEQFLDRAGLLKEAENGLAKGVPEDLKWFPFDQLPQVHWQDNGKAVASVILRWWLVQGFKLKSPEPGALLRRYCASIIPAEREALGQFILEAWMTEDTAPISRAEAEKRAQAHAQSMAQMAQYFQQHAQNIPQGVPAPPLLTVEQYYAQALPNFLKQPKGSAIASKGVMSVAGACISAGAAPVVSRYLKEWYGQRAAHCRALLQMLAWVEHRTATQLLLAVGSRFRTKGIQEEANIQAQALAERKGWSVAELADRTIPSAGLDESGVMSIDFGPRRFTATLNEHLELALSDAEGKTLKSLPDPRKDDDEAKAAEAKKTFSAAKKELKSVLTMQRDRLYEAMCTQRAWPFEDWNLYLNRHPIVRHHCQRLVWAVVRDGKAIQMFRPLPDGSLTDVADEPVTLGAEDLVSVAHECQVTPEQSQAWRQHFKDYNIETLFEQFGRQNFKPAEESRDETEVAAFQGHVLEAFKLRGRANKLGYTRGQAQDGGWFFDYHKRFPTLGLEAVIEFTGNGLPEENRNVALTVLHFDRITEGGDSFGGGRMTLSEVPSVLLSECWNDLRAIAAEGSGFDSDWEKKTQP